MYYVNSIIAKKTLKIGNFFQKNYSDYIYYSVWKTDSPKFGQPVNFTVIAPFYVICRLD